jgi:hypothetical protein
MTQGQRVPSLLRPLPLQAPTSFVRIRPPGRRTCGESRTVPAGRCRAASRRLPRQ